MTRLFSIPAASPFLPTLARALLEGRLIPGFPGDDPLALAEATIYLPTQRAFIEPDTQLRQIIGADEVKINSLHHQAVDQVGPGLRVTARTAEVVEGLGVIGSDTVVGVQWHPELLIDTADHLHLFEWLVATASR